MKPIDLDPEAADEIREAVDYLESQRPGSGDEFGEAVQDALGIISKQPKALAPYRTRFWKYVIKKFGYLIFYAELDDRIWVTPSRTEGGARITGPTANRNSTPYDPPHEAPQYAPCLPALDLRSRRPLR